MASDGTVDGNLQLQHVLPLLITVQDLMILHQGRCASAIVFGTRDGQSGDVSLKGRTVVFAVDFPGPTLFDANATARLYIDDGASADQRRELEAICSGQKGSIAVGEAGRVESRRLRDPQGEGFTLRGGGFVSGLGMEQVDLAPSGSRWTDPDLRRFETKSGARGDFSWSA